MGGERVIRGGDPDPNNDFEEEYLRQQDEALRKAQEQQDQQNDQGGN